MKITEKQRTLLEYIEWFIKSYGYAPTCAEISEDFDWKSDNAAWEHIKALEKKGILATTPKTARSIRVLIKSEDLG